MTALKNFAEKWCHPEYGPEPVQASDLDAIEAEFGVSLPLDYREQVLAVGVPSPTRALLSTITDKQLNLRDLADLFSPEEISDQTIGWRKAGMPDTLLVIGNDCMGNSFCFDVADLDEKTSDDAPVYFWDHDGPETKKVANSFSDWISSYQGSWSDGVTYADF